MENREKWDLRFLDLAKHISQWSKDPSTKVGAVVVDNLNRIVGIGYNGFPVGTDDSDELYNDRDVKISKIVHGEINALTFSNKTTQDCTLYVWPFGPCDRCSGIAIQHGISRVVFPKTNIERWVESIDLGKKYFSEASVEITEYDF